MIQLSLIHWVFLVLFISIIFLMIIKKDTMFSYFVAILIFGLFATGSVTKAIGGIFGSLLYAFKDLSNIIFAIACVTALSKLLEKTGILEFYLKPLTKIIKNKYVGFWIIGIITLVIALFFYPSPTVVLIAMMFLPVAKKIKMPIMWVAVTLNLFAHGFASSGDYILHAAHSLVAKAANIPVETLMQANIPIWLVMGFTTALIAFILLCKNEKNKKQTNAEEYADNELIKELIPIQNNYNIKENKKKIFAYLTLIALVLDIILMFILQLKTADANALLCGTVIIMICIISIFGLKGTKEIENSIVYGMKYSIELFIKAIPMAAFFYLGDSAFNTIYGEGILNTESHGIINDLGVALTNVFSINKATAVIVTGTLGAITGLDGSGISGISLVGTTAALLTQSFSNGTAVVAAFGQILAKYVGSGCLVPVAALPVAIACDIDVRELIKFNLKPILIGAIITGIVTFFLI